MLKVAIAAAYPSNPDQPGGGPEAGLAAMLPSLAQFGDLDLQVVTIDPRVHDLHIERYGRVVVHRLPKLARSELWNAIGPGRRQLSEYVLQLKPDVVHARDTYGLMVQNLPIPRVLSIHGFIHADTALQPGLLAPLRARLWRHVELRGWSKYPHLIAISPYVREKLSGIARGVIHDIDNPAHADFFNVSRQDQGNRVLFAGVLTHLKNPMAILEAAIRLGAQGSGMEFRLAGQPREPRYFKRMREFVREKGLERNVQFLGKLGRHEIQQELAATSVFVLPSLQENSPLSIVEAMAAGVPVVTSNRCGMPYMVRDGESGFLVDPTNPDDIARRLQVLLEDAALRDRMGGQARLIARDRFHPQRVASRTRDVYVRASDNCF